MRIQRLHIPSFGPFTDLQLNFPDQASDLHVIYGTNEAGKSSLLRAIRDMLFGIHAQSTDNFLHDYKEMRIKGEIFNRAGEGLSFQRRKGNKNTLLDADGNQLPDNALVPFLGIVDQTYFSAMFGLGTSELREGAQQLLRGEGDIGNALFSASMGGTPIHRVLEALAEESDRLFKGRVTANVSIRPATNRYKELLRQSRETAVNPEAWEKIEKELVEMEEFKAKLEVEYLASNRDLEWISRCEDALPTVGRLGEETRKLKELSALPHVPTDFVERVRTSRTTTLEAQAELHRLTVQLAKLEAQLMECQVKPALLAKAAALDRLHQDVGAYHEGKTSLVDREAKRAGIEPGLRAGIRNLELQGGLESIETLRLNSPTRIASEDAAKELQKAMDEESDNAEKLEGLKRQIETRETKLQLLPEADLTALRAGLSTAAGATEANHTYSAAESEVTRLTREAAHQHARLVGAPQDFDATADLSIPTKATIRRIRDEMDGIRRNIKAEEAKTVEGKKRIENIQEELGRMERRGELPSEEALLNARVHRDHGWSLVLAEWKGGGAKEELVPGSPLEEAFPQAIVQADDVADQLRLQAEAVAQAEEKRFQIVKSEKQNRESHTKTAELQAALSQCQAAWNEAWIPCRVAPLSPDEMEEWRETWNEFREVLSKWRTAQEVFEQKRIQIQHAKTQLATVLNESEEKDFLSLFDEAKRRVQMGEQTAGRRDEVTDQLQVLKIQVQTLEQNRIRLDNAVAVATQKWTAQCHTIGLPAGTRPKVGLILLQERKELLTMFDSWKELSAELKAISVKVQEFEQEVNEHAEALDIKGDTTEAQEAALWSALAIARDGQTRHDHLDGQIKVVKSELDDIQESASQAVQALEALKHLAKLETAEALEPLLVNLELQDRAQDQIDTFRGTLSSLARGQTVDEFLSRVCAEDPDELPHRKTRIEFDRQEKQQALQGLRDKLFELNSQKQKLEAAGDVSADYRQQAESCAAGLKQDASRFVRLRLATHLLHTQIERFRKENQGPLLEKSGQIFHSVTRGAFAGLGAQFNANDVPVLVGLRPDQSPVSVEGMSDGSRDQLYLALRLAALDQYLGEHEPMPLILDDLLITFDDERAKAILAHLARLARRTQIFLLTHHDHLVQLCRQTLGEDEFQLHRIGGEAVGYAG